MTDSRTEKLAAFVDWARAHVTGDEKGQAQIFLDRLFIAFGHAGSLDVGGEAECRIRKSSDDGGGTSFADYVEAGRGYRNETIVARLFIFGTVPKNETARLRFQRSGNPLASKVCNSPGFN